jgi:hypothetical protein
LLVFGTTALTACALLWSRARRQDPGSLNPISVLVLAGAALLCVVLPIQHGVFVADRKARKLERVPDGAMDLQPPVWLVDRGADDRVVILSREPDGRAKLTSVKADRLDGIAVTRVASLAEVMGRKGTP